ncbi:MAG: response regulator transcription factor [Firmicutes bacterium]|nr:response regulator transcription factor [Bacillota bacterium]
MSVEIRLLIVDDHPLFRQGVRFYLESIPELELIGEVENGKVALSFLAEHSVDLILMDLQMPGMDGVETTKRIKEAWPETKVLVLTSFNSWDQVYTALKSGASGYILKDAPPEELVAAIKAVANGGLYLGTQVANEILSPIGSEKETVGNKLPEPLTNRELEVLRQIGRGLGNRAIASELVLSEKTVKTHVANILQKLQVTNRTQAALYAIRHNLM